MMDQPRRRLSVSSENDDNEHSGQEPPKKKSRASNASATKNSQQATKTPLHRGKWTPEEEEYVQCLIKEFKAGFLPIEEGTTLRSFLSKMLDCNPKRISKKYDGTKYNGKQVYVKSIEPISPEEARQRQERLSELERRFQETVMAMRRVESKLRSMTGGSEAVVSESQSEERPRPSLLLVSDYKSIGGGEKSNESSASELNTLPPSRLPVHPAAALPPANSSQSPGVGGLNPSSQGLDLHSLLSSAANNAGITDSASGGQSTEAPLTSQALLYSLIQQQQQLDIVAAQHQVQHQAALQQAQQMLGLSQQQPNIALLQSLLAGSQRQQGGLMQQQNAGLLQSLSMQQFQNPQNSSIQSFFESQAGMNYQNQAQGSSDNEQNMKNNNVFTPERLRELLRKSNPISRNNGRQTGDTNKQLEE